MRQFLGYLGVGGLAAALNWSSRFLFSRWFGYSTAIVFAFLVGLTTGFVLMRWLVFDSRTKPASRQIPVYLLVNVLALAQTLLVSLVLARWIIPAMAIHMNPEGPAHLIGVLVPGFTSYFGHKYFTFR